MVVRRRIDRAGWIIRREGPGTRVPVGLPGRVPDGRLSVHSYVVDAEHASVEGVFAGVHDGVLQSPQGAVDPTGRSVTFRWSATYRVRGSELVSEHLYFDQLDFLGQLGLLPG